MVIDFPADKILDGYVLSLDTDTAVATRTNDDGSVVVSTLERDDFMDWTNRAFIWGITDYVITNYPL